MALKKCTVASAKVAATLTNYPTYVDLARVGVTTLAEAQSIRVYADESKTTEWAREIVSATEMHVKIPSLTTTTVIYVDYDGVRSDYGVTDTYGRNAVWGDYREVFHMQTVSSNTTPNSTGGTDGWLDFADTGVTFPTTTTGKVGGGFDFGTTAQKRGVRVNTVDISTTAKRQAIRLTIQQWNYPTSAQTFYGHANDTGISLGIAYITDKYRFADTGGNKLTPNTNVHSNWHMVHMVKDGDTAGFGTVNAGNTTTLTFSATSASELSAVGIVARNPAILPLGGLMDEYRLRLSAVSANWITTEYNNQNDEATFWPTWEDVGGAVDKNGFLAWL